MEILKTGDPAARLKHAGKAEVIPTAVWIHPANLEDSLPTAETPYKRWACNNCDECKGDSKAGGPWQPYRGPSRDIVKPVDCITSVNVSAKSSKRAVQNYCNNYHKTLERRKIHTQKGGCSCNPYKAVSIKKNAGRKRGSKIKRYGIWPFYSYKRKYYTYYTKWTGKCVIR